MKKIICYGDSNTFGFNPKDGSRYDSNTRWAGILAKILGDEFEVIEEGMNNRTGFFTNPDGFMQSGQEYLPMLLEKHKTFDVFILALGTNDLQKFFQLDENIIIKGLEYYVETIRYNNPNAELIVISPVILDERILKGYFKCQFDEKSIMDSIWMKKIYKDFCQKQNYYFLDINQQVIPSDKDGLHFDKESHKIIADFIAVQIFKKAKSYKI